MFLNDSAIVEIDDLSGRDKIHFMRAGTEQHRIQIFTYPPGFPAIALQTRECLSFRAHFLKPGIAFSWAVQYS